MSWIEDNVDRMSNFMLYQFTIRIHYIWMNFSLCLILVLGLVKYRLVTYKYSLDLNRKALIISLFAIQSPSIDNWYADSWIHFECELDLQQQLYMIWFWYFIQIIWWKNRTSWTEFKSDIIHGRKNSITLQYLVYSTTVHDNVSVHDRDKWGGHYIGRECNSVLVKPW